MKYKTKFICKTFSQMDVIFRGESNDGNYSMIGYSTQPLIMQSNVSLNSSREVAQGLQ